MKKKLVSGLVIGSVILSSITTTLADNNLEAISINNSNLSATAYQVATVFNKVSDNVYILSSDEIVDGIPGGVLSGEKNGSIVFVENGKLSSESQLIIKRAKNVYAIGGKEIIPDSILSGISNFKGRISGNDRYETAVEIAKYETGSRNIIITNGQAYADSLAATSYAVKNDLNILLVNTNSVPEATAKYLKDNKNAEIYFVGGNASVSENVKKEIYEITGKDTSKIAANTIAGENRYETSLKLAERFGSYDSVIVTNGLNNEDSILASSLGSVFKAPVILTDNSYVSANVGKLNKVNRVYSVSTQNLSFPHLKTFIRTLLNDNTVKMNINDIDGAVAYTIAPEVPKTMWATQGLNVRSGAGTGYSTIGSISKGDKVTGVDENGWLKFDYNGKTGYVSAKYLSASEVAKETAPSTDNNQSNTSSNSDMNFSYSKVLTVKATAYSKNEPGLNNKTASGIDLNVNPNVIAVDRSVIPLGTKVYVEGYGYAIAGDTGGAIKGNKIDVHFNSLSDMNNWGVKTVKVYILN